MGKCMKKPIPLSFRFAAKEEIVQTLEGAVTAKAGDAILTGTKGERWPISRDKFEQTYDYSAPTGVCSKKPILVDFEKMDEPFEVKVGWSAEPIKGKAGDYRLTYGPGDFGVVASEIFAETYEEIPQQQSRLRCS